MAQDEYDTPGDEGRARRRRSVVTFAVVLLLLFFAVWYALSYIRADRASGSASTSTSTPAPTCMRSPSDVEVNVYNATNRDGLAARVARQLKARGFTVKTVANDPKKVTVEGAGQLRYGRAGKPDADFVAGHTGPLRKLQDSRTRTTVDIVRGPDFERLVRSSEVTTC